MADYRKFFDKPYLGHWDLPEGRDAVVTIEMVEAGELHVPGNKAEKKPLLTLKNTPKKLVCNATNAKTIARLYGTDTDEWIGKKIALFKTETNAKGGEVVPCIRIRNQVPQPKAKREEPAQGDGAEEQPS